MTPTDTPQPTPSTTPTATATSTPETSTKPGDQSHQLKGASDTSSAAGVAAAAVTSITVTAEADAWVEQAKPTTNNGTASTLIVDSSPRRETYVRFTVSGLSGAVQQATLRLFATDGTTNGPAANLAGNEWTETGITWNTKPALISAGVDDKGAIAANTWVEFNVTSLVTGNGTYTFTFPPVSSDGVTFTAREAGTNGPQLVIAYDPSASPPPPTVSASPPGGTYATAQSVTLTASEPATIYYTLDGSDPTTASPVYASPLQISSTTTLKFFAVTPDNRTSAIVTEVYTIDASAPQTLVLTPEADARVEAANPTTNYGSASTLIVDGDPLRESYLRFTVQGTGAIQQATLRLYAANGTTKAPQVYLTDTNWTESGITWNTKPAVLGSGVAGPASFPDATWVEYDVTSLVTGNGPVSFTLPPVSSDGVTFTSRETGTPPQLVILTAGSSTATATVEPTSTVAATATPTPTATLTTDPTSTPTQTPAPTATPTNPPTNTPTTTPTATPGGTQTLVLTPEADARVEIAHPTTNFGTATTLGADQDRAEESYLRFALSGLSGSIQQASLRLYATSATVDGPQIYTASNAWEETTITWNARPGLLAGPSGDVGAIRSGTWVEFDVTSLVSGGGPITLAVVGTSTDGVSFASREASANRPQLVIQYTTATPTNTPTSAPEPTAMPSETATNTPTTVPTTIPTQTPTATAVPTPTASPTPSPVAGGDTLFADGFESGDLSKWSRVKGLVVQQQIVMLGSFAARGTSTSAATYARATLPAPQNDVYFRTYVYIASQSANTVYIMRCRTAQDKSILGVYVNGSGRLGYRNDVAGLSTTTTIAVSKNAWHEVVVHATVNGSSGQVELWLDGTLVASKMENLGTNPIAIVQIGENGTGSRSYDIAFDEVLVSGAQIAATGAMSGAATSEQEPKRKPTPTFTPQPTETPTLTATSTPDATATEILAPTATAEPTVSPAETPLPSDAENPAPPAETTEAAGTPAPQA